MLCRLASSQFRFSFADLLREDRVSSLTVWKRRLRKVAQSVRFPPLQFGLAMSGGLGGIGPGLEIDSLDEVAPAFVPVGGVLGILILLQAQFCILLAPDHGYHPGGEKGADVMPNNSVGSAGVVEAQ